MPLHFSCLGLIVILLSQHQEFIFPFHFLSIHVDSTHLQICSHLFWFVVLIWSPRPFWPLKQRLITPTNLKSMPHEFFNVFSDRTATSYGSKWLDRSYNMAFANCHFTKAVAYMSMCRHCSRLYAYLYHYGLKISILPRVSDPLVEEQIFTWSLVTIIDIAMCYYLCITSQNFVHSHFTKAISSAGRKAYFHVLSFEDHSHKHP